MKTTKEQLQQKLDDIKRHVKNGIAHCKNRIPETEDDIQLAMWMGTLGELERIQKNYFNEK